MYLFINHSIGHTEIGPDGCARRKYTQNRKCQPPGSTRVSGSPKDSSSGHNEYLKHLIELCGMGRWVVVVGSPVLLTPQGHWHVNTLTRQREFVHAAQRHLSKTVNYRCKTVATAPEHVNLQEPCSFAILNLLASPH